MPGSRKDLFLALAMIAGGILAFFVFLFLVGADPDERRLGLVEWMVGGMLIAPGFGYLIRWRKSRDGQRSNR